MTLGAKLSLRIAALIVALLLLALVAVWGVTGLRGDLDQALAGLTELGADVDRAVREYEKLADLNQVGQAALRARAIATWPRPGQSDPLAEAARFAEQWKAFLERQRQRADEPALAGAADLDQAQRVLHELRAALAAAGSDSATAPANGGQTALLAALNAAVNHLAQLSQTARERIGALQRANLQRSAAVADLRRQADQHARTQMLLVGVLTGLIVTAAVIVGVVQYRGVMSPLHRLRLGVRTIARGHFSQRLAVSGDREFADLAEDFNRMAAELETLYRDLETQVALKSRELVRSERLASVGFLAAGVAHEINNPLGIITGWAEIALRKLEKQPAAPEADPTLKSLRIICDEAYRCKRITQKLLSLARGGSEGSQDCREVALDQVAAEVVEMTAALSRYRDRKVTLDFDPRPLTAWASDSQMKQVLLNLVVNALEATAPGTGRVAVRGRARSDPAEAADAAGDQNAGQGAAGREEVAAWAELTVSDNGKGMTVHVLEHVFEPFFTDKRGSPAPAPGPAPGASAAGDRRHPDEPTNSDRGEAGTPGTGLGLSIVHAIVQDHGGRIRAASAGPGQGSVFTVLLPRRTAPARSS